jgi:hypothetical protein
MGGWGAVKKMYVVKSTLSKENNKNVKILWCPKDF